MSTYLYADEIFGKHETPDGHVEAPARYRTVEAALAGEEFGALLRKAPPRADAADVKAVHRPEYVDALLALDVGSSIGALDNDTFVGPHSIEAALKAAGGAIAAVDAVAAGEARNAFVATRPPGHHATPDRAMGFCLFNSAAIAARRARSAHGARRIAVVDFDVHHGNGTEAAFWHDENAFFASSHEHPQYPGTGRETDRGASDNIVNAPLPTGTDATGFRRAWGERLLPALSDFDPDFIVISAGFDAHARDPLGGLRLTEDDFAWATSEILAVARSVCSGRVVSVLEGGYDLPALGASVAAHVGALMAGAD